MFFRCLRDISRQVQALSPDERTGDVVQRFLDDPELASLPVVDGTRPVGMISRGDTLAVGCVHPDLDDCRTHHQLSLLLADAKASAKQAPGSHLIVSRRRKVG